MPVYDQFWNEARTFQVSQFTPIIDTPYGQTTATQVFWVYNDKGAAFGDTTTMTGYRLVPYWNDGVSWLRAGHPMLNEAWLQCQITAMDNTGDGAMVAQTTSWAPLGAGRPIALSPIPKNCGRKVEFRWVIPVGAKRALPQIIIVPEPSPSGLLSGTDLVCTYTNVPYSAANFTASGGTSPTWVVEAADQHSFSYRLLGKEMKVDFLIQNSTVTGGPGALQIAIPAGFTSDATTGQHETLCAVWENGVAKVAHVNVPAAATKISISPLGYGSNWANGTNNWQARGSIAFPVQ